MLSFLLLCGCSRGQALDLRLNTYPQNSVDTTSEAAYAFMLEHGYPDALMTGRRDEDCDVHAISGYGVIIKKIEKDGRPNAKSGVLCQSDDGEYQLRLDEVSAQQQH